MFHILTFTHQTPKEELGLKRYRIVEYISSTFESSVSVLLFHEFRRKGTVMRRTETDSKGERRKVCLFFFPFIYLDNSDLPLSLCRRLSVSFSLYRYFFFVFILLQRDYLLVIHPPDSLLNYLPSVSQLRTCCKCSITLSCPFIFMCVLWFSSGLFLLIITLSDLQQNSICNLI